MDAWWPLHSSNLPGPKKKVSQGCQVRWKIDVATFCDIGPKNSPNCGHIAM